MDTWNSVRTFLGALGFLWGVMPGLSLGAKSDSPPQNRVNAGSGAAVPLSKPLESGRKPQEKAVSSGGEKPAARVVPAAPPSGPTGQTTISAKKRLLFDPNGHEVTFWGDVQVVDARFSMGCEKLVVHLRKAALGGAKVEESPAQGATEKPLAGNATKGDSGEDADGALEKAVAEGDVVIFQEKVNEKGEVERRIGRARKAVYDAQSGLITLSGWPQIEHKASTIVAAEEGTVFVLDRKGGFEVLGHSRSVLRSTSPGKER